MSLKKARAGLDPIIDRGKAGTRRFMKRALSRWERRTKRMGRRQYFGWSS